MSLGWLAEDDIFVGDLHQTRGVILFIMIFDGIVNMIYMAKNAVSTVAYCLSDIWSSSCSPYVIPEPRFDLFESVTSKIRIHISNKFKKHSSDKIPRHGMILQSILSSNLRSVVRIKIGDGDRSELEAWPLPSSLAASAGEASLPVVVRSKDADIVLGTWRACFAFILE